MREMTLGIALIIGLPILRAVITHFKWRIDNTIPTSSNRAIRSARGIGKNGIFGSLITLLTGIQSTIPADCLKNWRIDTIAAHPFFPCLAGRIIHTAHTTSLQTESGGTLIGIYT